MDFSEKADHRTAAIGALVQVLLAENDCAPGAQAADNLGVFGGDAIFEQRTGCRGANSRRIDNVFESDRDAVKWSEMGAVVDLPLRLAGAVEGGVGGDGDVCAQPWVELFDARQAIVGEFDGREFAVAD